MEDHDKRRQRALEGAMNAFGRHQDDSAIARTSPPAQQSAQAFNPLADPPVVDPPHGPIIDTFS
jgi:hypothetical protein